MRLTFEVHVSHVCAKGTALIYMSKHPKMGPISRYLAP